MIRGGTGLGFLTDAVLAEYVRCYTLKTITGSCNDYRATATCDLEMDSADAERRIEMPSLIVWGGRGQSPERARRFIEVWRGYAADIAAWEDLPCGHYIAEEVPDRVYEHLTGFF